MNEQSTTLRLCLLVALLMTAVLASGCASSEVGATASSKLAPQVSTSIPGGTVTLSASRACGAIVSSGAFTDVERVHLVLTTYAKGEPVESEGDINYGMPPATPVWIVEVHAKAINWNHSVPPGYTAPKQPADDYSVVMNATTGRITDRGECRCWPLPR